MIESVINKFSKSMRPQQAGQHCAVVVGVGASLGIGAAMCRRIAREGVFVYVVGRSVDKLDAVVADIAHRGGRAEAYVLDATQSQQVEGLFLHIAQRKQLLELVVHNVGLMQVSFFLSSSLKLFDAIWKNTFLSGFLVGQQAAAYMLKQQYGTIIFTGAAASLRGKPYFSAFAMGKAALRAYARGLAQELLPYHVHVAHVVIDGVVDGERANTTLRGVGWLVKKLRGGGVQVDAIANSYWFLHQQHEPLWADELDLRHFLERF